MKTIINTNANFLTDEIKPGDLVYNLSKPWYKKFYRWFMWFIGGYPKHDYTVASVNSETELTIRK